MTITAKIIADSISESGVRITTFELEFPRIVMSEFLTHRIFSRNAASSRAIPVKSMNEAIKQNIARPIQFGKNQSGMQDAGEHFELIEGKYTPQQWWDMAAEIALDFSNAFDRAGYHKQVCNRLTEPFQHMKVVLTSTSYDNWFNLRWHEDADPTIHVLADVILAAYEDSEPRLLLEGEWHTPYFQDGYWSPSHVVDGEFVAACGTSLGDALKISSSCCAQVSFRKSDDTLEKAKLVYSRLVESFPVHASPTEHQATPIACDKEYQFPEWPDGVTHMDRDGVLYSGNFKGWIQHRQLIPNHDCTKFVKN
jgi:hypothetical protein